MKRYVKNNKVLEMFEVRRELPNMSIPEDANLSEYGYEFLIETLMPQQEGFYAVEVEPVNNVQTWELLPIPEAEEE